MNERPTPAHVADVLMRYCGVPLHPHCRDEITRAIQAERDHYEARIAELLEEVKVRGDRVRLLEENFGELRSSVSHVFGRIREEQRILGYDEWRTAEYWARELGIDLDGEP